MDTTLEQRVARLEAAVEPLQNRTTGSHLVRTGENNIEEIQQMIGILANDPLFEEMVRLVQRTDFDMEEIKPVLGRTPRPDPVLTEEELRVKEQLETIYSHQSNRLDPVMAEIQAHSVREEWDFGV